MDSDLFWQVALYVCVRPNVRPNVGRKICCGQKRERETLANWCIVAPRVAANQDAMEQDLQRHAMEEDCFHWALVIEC